MEANPVGEDVVLGFCRRLFGAYLHDKRCRSIAYGLLGVMHCAELSVAGVGRGMARARNLSPKHGIKQVDRLLSNPGILIEAFFKGWVPWVVGDRDSIVVAFDWTEHAHDGQSTIALYLVTRHGRAPPLLWRTVESSELKDNRNRFEDEVLVQLSHLSEPELQVTVLADRGFGDVALYDLLDELGYHYVIRFRGCIYVRTEDGRRVPATELVSPTGAPSRYNDVELTRSARRTPGVITVYDKKMKEPWFLATRRTESAAEIVALYGRRFTIEETLRDTKHPHFGLGLSQTHIGTSGRRDRMLMLVAIAHALLTFLGRAGETLGLDRQLRANTTVRRTHSLFRQGREYLRGVLRTYVRELRHAFLDLLRSHRSQTDTYSWIGMRGFLRSCASTPNHPIDPMIMRPSSAASSTAFQIRATSTRGGEAIRGGFAIVPRVRPPIFAASRKYTTATLTASTDCSVGESPKRTPLIKSPKTRVPTEAHTIDHVSRRCRLGVITSTGLVAHSGQRVTLPGNSKTHVRHTALWQWSHRFVACTSSWWVHVTPTGATSGPWLANPSGACPASTQRLQTTAPAAAGNAQSSQIVAPQEAHPWAAGCAGCAAHMASALGRGAATSLDDPADIREKSTVYGCAAGPEQVADDPSVDVRGLRQAGQTKPGMAFRPRR